MVSDVRTAARSKGRRVRGGSGRAVCAVYPPVRERREGGRALDSLAERRRRRGASAAGRGWQAIRGEIFAASSCDLCFPMSALYYSRLTSLQSGFVTLSETCHCSSFRMNPSFAGGEGAASSRVCVCCLCVLVVCLFSLLVGVRCPCVSAACACLSFVCVSPRLLVARPMGFRTSALWG